MSLFYRTFAHGRIGRLTREEEDSISRGLAPARLLHRSQRMAPFSKRASSWGRGRSFGGATKAKRRLGYSRPLNIRALGWASGYTRTGGFYGRFSGRSQEMKFHDIDANQGTIALAGNILNGGSINLIGQATTESTRIGRKCTIKSILWRYNITTLQQSDMTAEDTVRVIMYLDKQANGATATVANILAPDSTYQSYNNLQNSSRFRILYDKTHTMNPKNAAGNGSSNFTGQHAINSSFYKRCNIPLEFSGVANPSVLTEVRSNNVGVLLISKVNNISAFDSKIRLRFTDS